MTFKKAIFYYSLGGNTESVFAENRIEGYDIYRITRKNVNEIPFNDYDEFLLGTSTLGDGELPKPFEAIIPLLSELKGKKIGIFGSGNKVYRHFCGALDILEKLLQEKNEIVFVYKFDEYPTQKVFKEFTELVKRLD